MAISPCPKCRANLKVPDNAVATVRCPKCQTVFQSKPASAAPVPPPPAQPPARPAPAPADFEVVEDEPRRRPVSRRGDDSDDYDDRPRRRGRRDEDDDDRDRPSRKKKRRDDDDYDDDFRSGSIRRTTTGGPGKTGAFLLSISFWCDVGLYGLLTLVAIIFWTSAKPTLPLGLLVGPLRVTSWVLGLVGIGFCVAGPLKARKLSIATAILAGLHLAFFISGLIYIGVSLSDLNPNRRAEHSLDADSLGALGLCLGLMTSILPAEFFLAGVSYGAHIAKIDYLIFFYLGSACDIARLILELLTLKAMAESAKDYGAVEKLRIGVISVSSVCGGAILLLLLVTVLFFEADLGRARRHVMGLALLLVMLSHSLMMVFPALGALQTASGLKKRKKKA